MAYRAVLFDLDGTLLDSDEYWQTAHRALFASRLPDLPPGAPWCISVTPTHAAAPRRRRRISRVSTSKPW
ncbi:MAG: hypothetical protein ABW022_21240 [Actinoplanes sp.]